MVLMTCKLTLQLRGAGTCWLRIPACFAKWMTEHRKIPGLPASNQMKYDLTRLSVILLCLTSFCNMCTNCFRISVFPMPLGPSTIIGKVVFSKFFKTLSSCSLPMNLRDAEGTQKFRRGSVLRSELCFCSQEAVAPEDSSELSCYEIRKHLQISKKTRKNIFETKFTSWSRLLSSFQTCPIFHLTLGSL